MSYFFSLICERKGYLRFALLLKRKLFVCLLCIRSTDAGLCISGDSGAVFTLGSVAFCGTRGVIIRISTLGSGAGGVR